MKKISFVFICVLLFIPIVSVADTIKIGYVIDLSGIGAFFGVQSRRGATLAVEDFNSKQVQLVKETKLEILFEDTKGKTPDAVTAVIKLLNSEKVDAVICDLTAVCTAISQKVKQANKVLIYHSPSLKIREMNPYAFRNFMDYESGCKKVTESWRSEGKKYIATIMANSEFGELCEKGAKKTESKIDAYNYNAGDDIRSLITAFGVKIKENKGNSGVMFTGFEGDFVNFFKLLNEFNLSISVGFPEIILSRNLIDSAKLNIDQSLIYGFENLSEDFKSKLFKRFQIKDEPNLQGIALGYNAVSNLSLALIECHGSADVVCVAENLKQDSPSKLMGFRGFAGDLDEYPIVLKSWREVEGSYN